MKRILLRSRKGPFDVVSPEISLAKNTIGDNSGNLVFSHAVHRMLFTADAEITSNRFRVDPRGAGEINERYDVFVIPLANAFRLSFEGSLLSMTKLIERLRIPVVVFGVGAQGTLDYDGSRLNPIEKTVKRFARAVLDRSPSIGVRGEFTQQYLQRLGFRDLDVIGCPSMFFNGDSLHVEKKLSTLDPGSKLAISISPYLKRMGDIVMSHYRRYPDLTYIAQDLATLELLLWGEDAEAAGKSSKVPVRTSHPLYRENKIRFFVDPWPWISYLSEFDFSFGSRIHGGITSLVAGTPCHVLAHDSRTLELARYFGIPYTRLTARPPVVDAARLYEEADFTELNKGHGARFATLVDFMEKHHLNHVFSQHGDAGAAFDEHVRQVSFPPPVEALTNADGDGIASRLRSLRQSNHELAHRVAKLEARGIRKIPAVGHLRRLLRRL